MNRLVLTAALTLAAQPPQTAELAPVQSRKLEKTVSVPSDLLAFQSVALYAKVSGFVNTINVDRGSAVKKDQLLAVLVAPEIKARTLEAQARVQTMLSQAAEAKAKSFAVESTYERLKAASATAGAVAGHDLAIAEQNLEAAKANLEAAASGETAARAALEAVKEMETYLEIRAPFEGVVTERDVHPGSLVGPTGPPLMQVEQVSKLRLVVPVPEIYVATIAKGTRVRFHVAALPERVFEGVVQRPAQSLDVKTRSMMVELDVDNTDRLLAPGMYADVEWRVSRGVASLFVPASSIVRTTERQFVVRVREGVAEWVDVRRGEVQGDSIEVYGDIREGDTVVLRGNDEIRPGSRISAKPAEK